MYLRIGILQCDHVDNDLVDTHGDYDDMFSELFYLQDDENSETEIVIYDLTADHFPVNLDSCDGYLITGSRVSAYDTTEDVPWIDKAKALVVKLYKEKIPTIGICFGHQLIAESLGGKVEKATDKGWGVGVHQWEIKAQKDWMENNILTEISLRASHQDQVVKLPPDATLIASSDFCPIAGFQTGQHFLSFQGHPEFSSEYSNALIDKRVHRIGDEVADAAKKSLQKKVDGETVGAWMLRFIQKSRQCT